MVYTRFMIIQDMGTVMESVAFFGLVMLGNVEDYLAGTYVEPPGPGGT